MADEKIQTKNWNAADFIETEEDARAYIEAALEEKDLSLFSAALGEIARSKGMTALAKKTGMGRTSLYKALSADGQAQFSTIIKVLDALGYRFSILPKDERKTKLRAARTL
ncbi:MAG TPA: addiction module antidote protein [Anaerolineaceae bacterium]|nr:addiction module antidote protein [Anaerolineaceae bacterium]